MSGKNSLPSAAAVGKLRSWLATRGVPSATANAICQTTTTRGDMTDQLIAYINSQR